MVAVARARGREAGVNEDGTRGRRNDGEAEKQRTNIARNTKQRAKQRKRKMSVPRKAERLTNPIK